ncbi:MAG TPA: hypothetical protein VJV22_05555 [Acidobacteriaceae bacterium]|nr:hypothetical protein [Acidobacteriaceae bacterium]
MDETVYYGKSGVRVTDLRISTKKDTVLIRDISAVQLRSPLWAVWFGLLLAIMWAALAAGSYSAGRTGLMLIFALLAVAFLGATFLGRDVVVNLNGGRRIDIASGLYFDMLEIKNAISRAITGQPTA